MSIQNLFAESGSSPGGRGKSAKSLALIQKMHDILSDIRPATVRAACYQLFIAQYISSMAKGNTNAVGEQLKYARENNIIPWSWVVDETREVESQGGWENKEQFKRTFATNYRRSRWTDQHIRLEVWSEKGTVRGTLAPILEKYGVDFRVHHGFASATVLHDIAEESASNHKPLTVLYVGDFDPSGRYMVEVDLPTRLREYWEKAKTDRQIEFNITIQAVALNNKDRSTLPTFSAKESDRRHDWFVARHGRVCCELDALNPKILRQRLENVILELPIDWEAWRRSELCEKAEQESLERVLTAWARKPESISMPARK